MKSKICILIIVIALVTLMYTNLKSIGLTSANIEVDTKNVLLGKEVQISIRLKNNIDFSAGNFVLSYDNTVLEYKGYSVGDVLKKTDGNINGMLVLNEKVAGKIGIGYISDANQTEETKKAGELLKFTFNVKSGEGTSTNINLQATTLKKDDGTDVTANITNGKLTIISGIKIKTNSLEVKMGETSTLSVETLPKVVDITKENIMWKSSNTSIATVNSSGIITPVAPGSAEITATVLGTTAKCTIRVTAALKGISLNKTTLILLEGDEEILEVIYNPINTTDTRTVIWSSFDEKIATIDKNGKIKAISQGKTTVSANVNGKIATCNVTVISQLGDADNDKKITAYDVYMALEASVDIQAGIETSEKYIKILDVDKDGNIKAQDAYKILEYSVGLINKF